MQSEWLYTLSEPLIAIGILVLLIAATEVGYRAGAKVPARFDDVAKSQIGTLAAGILGLLALLLGFTFAMALSRFDQRRQLVTKEANGIATTYLRSRLLPEATRKQFAPILRAYVDARLEFFRAGIDEAKLNEVQERTKRLQNELWALVPNAVEQDPREITTGLFIESLNDTLDVETERLSAMQNHVPQSILLLLVFVSVMAMMGVGYGCGLGKSRHLFSTMVLALLLTLVTIAIMDLDRPRRGLIKISQDPMIRLQQAMQKDF